jgi:formamidopyrimidine-DNA glycosylase
VPELPDVVVYLEALERHVLGRTLERVRLASPFLVRSTAPPLAAAEGRRVVGLSRLGKRIVWELEARPPLETQPEPPLFLVFHLMIAGRFRWRERGAKLPGKNGLAAFDFDRGTVLLTEASSKKRASLHVVAGRASLADHDRGGLEVLEASAAELGASLARESHTLKRALTDPRILSGIGNAYSDEILHRARMSPFKRTAQLTGDEVERLHAAARAVLGEWIERGRREVGEGFPEKVTAFRPEMAVHGRYGQPCPVCGTPVQRLIYAENEANYCPACQTGGRLLADRALSRLMREDWPRTLEELEARKRS